MENRGLVILDVDGVVRDSTALSHRGMKEGFESAGLLYPFKPIQNWRLRGIGKYSDNAHCISAFMAALAGGADIEAMIDSDDPEAALDRLVREATFSKSTVLGIRKRYVEIFASQEGKAFVSLYPEAEAAMTRLYDSGYVLAFLSLSERSTIERDIPPHLLRLITKFLGRDDLANPKPHPEGLLHLMEHTKMPKTRTYFVGDAQNDIRTAHNAGCRGIGVLSGMCTRKMLEMEKPYAILRDLDELSRKLCDGGI